MAQRFAVCNNFPFGALAVTGEFIAGRLASSVVFDSLSSMLRNWMCQDAVCTVQFLRHVECLRWQQSSVSQQDSSSVSQTYSSSVPSSSIPSSSVPSSSVHSSSVPSSSLHSSSVHSSSLHSSSLPSDSVDSSLPASIPSAVSSSVPDAVPCEYVIATKASALSECLKAIPLVERLGDQSSWLSERANLEIDERHDQREDCGLKGPDDDL